MELKKKIGRPARSSAIESDDGLGTIGTSPRPFQRTWTSATRLPMNHPHSSPHAPSHGIKARPMSEPSTPWSTNQSLTAVIDPCERSTERW